MCCDDESSACCRVIYYSLLACGLICGCTCCLPRCDICHKVNGLERGVCDTCWDELLNSFNNAWKAPERRQQTAAEDTYTYTDTDEKDGTQEMPETDAVLANCHVYDKQTARKWLISHHPDRNAGEPPVAIEVFQVVLNYYKSC